MSLSESASNNDKANILYIFFPIVKMKISKKATSIIEAIVVMLIMVTGITGLYTIFNESQNLSIATKNRIEAIEIAKEGIEAFKNIRDTNWLLYGADTGNCWNTMNYDFLCVGSSGAATDIAAGSYTIYRDSDNRWILGNGSNIINKDSNGLYTQSGGTSFKPQFTRDIIVSYSGSTSDGNEMYINSIVRRASSDSKNIHEVNLSSKLRNWQK